MKQKMEKIKGKNMETAISTGRTQNTGEGLSGKDRLLKAMRASAKPSGWINKGKSTADLARQTGLDEHEVIHLITESLARQNLVTYRKGRSNSIIRLRLTPIAMGRGYAKGTNKTQWFKERFGDNPDAILTPQEQNDANLKTMVAQQSVSGVSEKVQKISSKKFPIIEEMASRTVKLSSAAELAEQAGQEDLAIQLMDRAKNPFSALEINAAASEMIELFNAYNDCVNSKSFR